MPDCLLIGFNDGDFNEFCSSIKALGERSTAWRDIRTSVVTHNGRYLRALDVLTDFRERGCQTSSGLYHNMDFLSPAILYLGSFLHDRSITFDYINLFHLEKERLKEKLQAGDILAAVVTTTLYVTPEPIVEVVRFIRQCDPNVRIILGGPYIQKETTDVSPEDIQRLFAYLDGDFYVMSSEGEQALYQIIAALKGDGRFEDIPSCAYKSGDGYRVNPLVPEENRLENTVIDYAMFPRRDLGELVSVRTALSCPFSCAYCGFPQRAGRHRAADIEHVERELNSLENIGNISTVTFLDDSFNVPRSRFKRLLQMMIRNRYTFKWNSFVRCDHVDEEIILLMKEAGCEGVFIGAESGNDIMLQRMNKNLRRKHLLHTVPLFRQAGIITHLSLIVGFPGETEDSIADTISLIEETQPDFYRAQLWYCDPMTPIWQNRHRYGIKGAGFNWSHDTMTSRAAMDWVEEMFMSVSGSIWLPQHGCELWSIFYLQRKGMTLDQVKRFLSCFNRTVKEQIMAGGSVDLNTGAGRNLQAACTTDSGSLPFPDHFASGSGTHYLEAQGFWRQVFHTLQPLSRTNTHIPVSAQENKHTSRLANIATILDAANQLNVDSSILMLSLFTAMLSRLYGEFVVSVSVVQGTMPLPLPFNVRWDGSFRDHLDVTGTIMQKAVNFGGLLPYFLDSPFHKWADKDTLSQIEVGFAMAEENHQPPSGKMLNQGFSEQLLLQLEAQDDYLNLVSAEPLMSAATAEDLVRYCNQALDEVLTDPNRLIGSLLVSEESIEPNPVEESIDFQF